MSASQESGEETEDVRSPLAGACVLVILGGGALAAVFAVSDIAGVLTLWFVGVIALHRSAHRMSDSRTTPPPPLSDDVYAAHSDEIERVQKGPGEGMTILYPRRADGEVK